MRIASAILVLLMITSCSKDKDPIPEQPHIFSIDLEPSYLRGAQVDSAFALWERAGNQQRVKLDIRNDSLVADIGEFAEGDGKLTLLIFSNKKYSNQYPGQWLAKKEVSINSNKASVHKGPQSFFDMAWLPRVALSDAIGHAAVVALRPDDPFFVVKDPGHDITKLTVDRGYWKTIGGVSMAGRDIWNCTQHCTDEPNEEHFKSLPGRIGAKPWNHISITVLFEINDDGQGWVISLEHEP